MTPTEAGGKITLQYSLNSLRLAALCFLPAALLLSSAGCESDKAATHAAVPSALGVCSELSNPDFVFAVLRYLYRWHFSEATFLPANKAGDVEVWVRSLKIETDEGDRSRFAEMWVPGAGLLVDLKQADHAVPERKLALKDDGFKVRAVEHSSLAPGLSADWTVVHRDAKEVYSHLLQTRKERLFVDAAMQSRLEKALAHYLRQHDEGGPTVGVQTFYAAPISPVSNDLWVFWENRRLALRFAADGDLADPRFWEQLPMTLRAVSLEQNVTVSRDEATAGGKVILRDWPGRLLYNCVVLGRKFTVRVP